MILHAAADYCEYQSACNATQQSSGSDSSHSWVANLGISSTLGIASARVGGPCPNTCAGHIVPMEKATPDLSCQPTTRRKDENWHSPGPTSTALDTPDDRVQQPRPVVIGFALRCEECCGTQAVDCKRCPAYICARCSHRFEEEEICTSCAVIAYARLHDTSLLEFWTRALQERRATAAMQLGGEAGECSNCLRMPCVKPEWQAWLEVPTGQDKDFADAGSDTFRCHSVLYMTLAKQPKT